MTVSTFCLNLVLQGGVDVLESNAIAVSAPKREEAFRALGVKRVRLEPSLGIKPFRVWKDLGVHHQIGECHANWRLPVQAGQQIFDQPWWGDLYQIT